MYITAKSHQCEQALDPDYTPSNAEKDIFEAKQIFMFSVFDKNTCLLTWGKPFSESNMLLQQKSAQMGNNLAEQQVNNNNKAKTKQQTQEQTLFTTIPSSKDLSFW